MFISFPAPIVEHSAEVFSINQKAQVSQRQLAIDDH
jgi:hypothetical protein